MRLAKIFFHLVADAFGPFEIASLCSIGLAFKLIGVVMHKILQRSHFSCHWIDGILVSIPEGFPNFLSGKEILALPLVRNLSINLFGIRKVTKTDVVELDEPQLHWVKFGVECPRYLAPSTSDTLQVVMQIDEHAFLGAITIFQHCVKARAPDMLQVIVHKRHNV